MKYTEDDQDLIRHAVLGYQVQRLAHQSAIADIDRKLARLLAPPVPEAANVEITTPRGKPPKALLAALAGKPVQGYNGWSSDPEERKAEAKRRLEVRKANQKKNSAQIRWKKSTPAERAKWLKAMQAGQRKKLRQQKQQTVERVLQRKQQQAVDNAHRMIEQHRQEASS